LVTEEINQNSGAALHYGMYKNQMDNTVHLVISNTTYLLIDFLISSNSSYTFIYEE